MTLDPATRISIVLLAGFALLRLVEAPRELAIACSAIAAVAVAIGATRERDRRVAVRDLEFAILLAFLAGLGLARALAPG